MLSPQLPGCEISVGHCLPLGGEYDTVDGRKLIGSLSDDLQGFIQCRFSFINSSDRN